MESCIFLTMPTSATASMWRIFSTIARSQYNLVHLGDQVAKGKISIDDLTQYQPEKVDSLVQFNVPTKFNRALIESSLKFIVNFRDPRDWLCNSFHWRLIHPERKDEDINSVKRRAERLMEKGIDSWVLEHAHPAYFDNLINVLETLDSDRLRVLSYARLCLDFDSFLDSAESFLGVDIDSKVRKSLEIERVENLSENSRWIGNSWSGSDVMPGRYKRELRSDTIMELNEIYSKVLSLMSVFDKDFEDLYK